MEDINGVPGSLVPTYVAPPVRFVEGPGTLAIRALRYEKVDMDIAADAAASSPIAKKSDDAMSYGIAVAMVLEGGKAEEAEAIKWRNVHTEEVYWGRNTKIHPMIEFTLTKKEGKAEELPAKVAARMQVSSVILHPGQVLDTWVSGWGENGTFCGTIRVQLSFTPRGSLAEPLGGELAVADSYFTPTQIQASADSWLNLAAAGSKLRLNILRLKKFAARECPLEGKITELRVRASWRNFPGVEDVSSECASYATAAVAAGDGVLTWNENFILETPSAEKVMALASSKKTKSCLSTPLLFIQLIALLEGSDDENTVANLSLPIYPFVLTYGHVCDEWYPLAWGDGENDIGDVKENVNRKAGEIRMLLEFVPGKNDKPSLKGQKKKHKKAPEAANSLCVSLIRSQGFVEAFEMRRKKEDDGRLVARSYAFMFHLEDADGRILSRARSLPAENLVMSSSDASLDPEWDEDIILKLPKDKSQKMTLRALLLDENAVLSDVAKNLGEVSIEVPANLEPVSEDLDMGELIPRTWYPVKAFGKSKLSDPQIRIGLTHGLGRSGNNSEVDHIPDGGGRIHMYGIKGCSLEDSPWGSIEVQLVLSNGGDFRVDVDSKACDLDDDANFALLDMLTVPISSAVTSGDWGGTTKIIVRNAADDLPLASCEISLEEAISTPFSECNVDKLDLVNAEGEVIGNISVLLLFATSRVGSNFVQLKSINNDNGAQLNEMEIFGKLRLVSSRDNSNPLKTSLSKSTTEGIWNPPTTLHIPIDNTDSSIEDTAEYVFTLYDGSETYMAGGKSYYLGETVLNAQDFNGKMATVALTLGGEDTPWKVEMKQTYKEREDLVAAAAASAAQAGGAIVSMPIIESASELKKVFYLVDVDGSGTISIEEMQRVTKKKKVKASLSALLGVEPSDVAAKMTDMLSSMDADGSGNASWDEFRLYVEQLERHQQQASVSGGKGEDEDADADDIDVNDDEDDGGAAEEEKDDDDDDDEEEETEGDELDDFPDPTVATQNKGSSIPALPVPGGGAAGAADKARIKFLMDVVRRLKAEGHYRKMQMQALVRKNKGAASLLQAMGKGGESNKENQGGDVRRYKEMKLRVQDLEEVNKSLNVQLVRTKQQAKHRLKMEKDAALSIIRASGVSASSPAVVGYGGGGDAALLAKLHAETRAKKALITKVRKLQQLVAELQQGKEIDASASALGSIAGGDVGGDLGDDPLGFEEGATTRREDPGQIARLKLDLAYERERNGELEKQLAVLLEGAESRRRASVAIGSDQALKNNALYAELSAKRAARLAAMQALDTEESAAITLQSRWKGAKERKKYERYVSERNAAASKIQSHFRGKKSRKDYAERRKEMNGAAIALQGAYRGYDARKTMRRQAESASAIQARYRGRLGRKKVAKMHEQRDGAATAIQAKFRQRRASAAHKAHVRHLNESAMSIQSSYRAKLAKRELMKLKEEDRIANETIAVQGKEFAAASLIQKIYRGKNTRERIKQLVNNPGIASMAQLNLLDLAFVSMPTNEDVELRGDTEFFIPTEDEVKDLSAGMLKNLWESAKLPAMHEHESGEDADRDGVHDAVDHDRGTGTTDMDADGKGDGFVATDVWNPKEMAAARLEQLQRNLGKMRLVEGEVGVVSAGGVANQDGDWRLKGTGSSDGGGEDVHFV